MSRPQFCYVLTTTGRDPFADMTYASVMFLREIHPEAEIVCLCDAASHRELTSSGHALLDVVDRTQSIDTHDGPPGFRNRYVKTQMRQILDGDFVYLDSDTLVVDRLDKMLACHASVGGIANHSGTDDPTGLNDVEQDYFHTMGWELPRKVYVNGGVLLLRDSDPARRFCQLWHEKWLAWTRRGRYTDQPSLNSALTDSGVDYEILPDRFNAQIGGKPSLCREPVAVWHIYTSQNESTELVPPRTI